jgi:CO dehydrogenase maturation factor
MNLREGEVILMDTQAGVEHFGRALAKGFHHALVVCDPTFNAVQVALHAARLAADMGIPAVHLVTNRVRDARESERLEARIAEEGGFPFASTHLLPYDEAVLQAEPSVGRCWPTATRRSCGRSSGSSMRSRERGGAVMRAS